MLTVEAPSAFHRNWVQRHFFERIRTTVESVAGRAIPVVLAVGTSNPDTAMAPDAAAHPTQALAPLRAPSAPSSINAHDLRFDTFVVGPSNAFAHAAAQTVASTPGRHYNPLCIHGGVGLGKTHLIHAIAHELRARTEIS